MPAALAAVSASTNDSAAIATPTRYRFAGMTTPFRFLDNAKWAECRGRMAQDQGGSNCELIKPSGKKAAPTRRSSSLAIDRRGTDQVFIAAFTSSAVIGSERTRAPTALKMALPIAGATTVTAGSPQPTAGSPLR